MERNLELIQQLLEAYEDFDHYDAPDFDEERGDLYHEGGIPVGRDFLRPADGVVRDRVNEDESGRRLNRVQREQLKKVYHHVGLLREGGYLVEREEVFGEGPLADAEVDHDVFALTMKGHDLLDELREQAEEEVERTGGGDNVPL